MIDSSVSKAIVLAGGAGTRLAPLTNVTNKHLLPVGRKPMIIHPIMKLVATGIQDIMIVTGTDHMGDMVSLLGSGKEYSCRFTYKVQDEPDGIAGALSLCREFVNSSNVIVVLGDNIFEDSLDLLIDTFNSEKTIRGDLPTCSFMLKKVPDPKRFGVATISQSKIVKIVEKPRFPETDLCVTGVYVYDNHVFRFIDGCKKSNRGEYEISDVNGCYIISDGASFIETDGWWTDAGTHESYQKANRYSFGELQ